MEESRLIELARQGQTEAFRHLFELHRQKVMAIAYSYLRNTQDAEDILQETFIKAYQALPSFNLNKGMNFSGWLTRISINCCLDLLRRHQSRQKKESNWAQTQLTNSPANHLAKNPESVGQLQALKDKIENYLEKLPPKQRMVFILRHYQGFTIREIAEDMGVSEGTVKRMLFRAFGRIRKHLKNYLLEKHYEMSSS
jgi:RNA polymerase sigma-70 factor (ECF subfamily)